MASNGGRRLTMAGAGGASGAGAGAGDEKKMFGRLSLGGRRQTLGGAGRPSIGRRSSAFGAKPAAGGVGAGAGVGQGRTMQDPRPHSDKAYQNQNIRVLITYLTSHMYDKPISSKVLTAPTSKDFRHIITFLFKQIDPSFEFGEKFEDEVKDMLKKFGYPVNISKNSLQAVGSPHTWPSLLAMLVWLIEYLQYAEEVDEKEAADVSSSSSANFLNENSEKVFFAYTAGAYQKFLDGDDAKLDQDLAKTFEEKNAHVQDDIKRFQQAAELLRTEIATLKNTEAESLELQNKRAYFLSDLQKFQKLVDQVSKHRDMLNKKLEERKAEVAERASQLESARQEKEMLEKQLSAQEITPLEVQRIAHHRHMLEESIATLSKQKETVQTECFAQENLVAKKMAEMEPLLQAFNAAAVKLQLLPITAKNAQGVDFDLNVRNMFTFDFKPVKALLISMKQKGSDRITQAQKEVRDTAEKLNQTNDVRAEQQEKVANLEQRLKKINDAYTHERQEMNNSLKLAVSKVEDVELELHRLRTGQTSALAESEKDLQLIEKKISDLESVQSSEREALNSEICDIMNEVATHKGRIQEVLEAIEAKLAANLAALSV